MPLLMTPRSDPPSGILTHSGLNTRRRKDGSSTHDQCCLKTHTQKDLACPAPVSRLAASCAHPGRMSWRGWVMKTGHHLGAPSIPGCSMEPHMYLFYIPDLEQAWECFDHEAATHRWQGPRPAFWDIEEPGGRSRDIQADTLCPAGGSEENITGTSSASPGAGTLPRTSGGYASELVLTSPHSALKI